MKAFSTAAAALLMLACATLTVHAQAQQNWTAAPLGWHPFNEALEMADKAEKKVLIDIYAPWCGWCRRMHEEVYPSEAVKAYVTEHFTLTRIDLTQESDTLNFKGYRLNSKMLAGGLGATGTPTTVFLEPGGDYITRLPGYADETEFLNVLRFIGSNAYQNGTYQEFLESQNPQATGGK